ncbi:DUF2214 family protein [Sapientia aquatica]|uniref:DUF2214 family protein n=2 Tax=Sapientia aquatica TaxID=1549640 RepID=A0A4R5W6G1_9BURK|nr:DUF2214 family protein [Sapientia aquatica]
MSAYFAFFHHIAAFALMTALALELVLLNGELSVLRAKQLMRVDLIYGTAAGLVLLIGLLRVFYFEKGSFYYFHNFYFHLKLGVFLLVGLPSIIPTMEFLSWRKIAAKGELPVIAPKKLKLIKLIIHLELLGIVVILFCAAQMAKGAGVIG